MASKFVFISVCRSADSARMVSGEGLGNTRWRSINARQPGALDTVADLATEWFAHYLGPEKSKVSDTDCAISKIRKNLFKLQRALDELIIEVKNAGIGGITEFGLATTTWAVTDGEI